MMYLEYFSLLFKFNLSRILISKKLEEKLELNLMMINLSWPQNSSMIKPFVDGIRILLSF